MEVHIAGDGANLRTEASNLVCEHAGGRNLDRIVPVVIVVAQGVCEVQDGHLADMRRVLGDVEMRRLDGTLGDGVRDEEEVELAIDDLGLLDEARVDVGTLRRVVDEVLLVFGRIWARIWGLLEEPLADTLVHDDERDVGWLLSLPVRLRVAAVLHLDDPV